MRRALVVRDAVTAQQQSCDLTVARSTGVLSAAVALSYLVARRLDGLDVTDVVGERRGDFVSIDVMRFLDLLRRPRKKLR